ncbi:MAG: tRNA pseudouridine(38-40) synthase TruA, partial [Verrucomicrobiales bacterium]|nr:tRNA pseudouridine(38-40) synthase TruA [Verrucomicrobiales bacterium]
PMSAKYAMILAYNGTDFCGWQIQKGTGIHENRKPSIEGTVTEAIRQLCGESSTVVSSGRTDAGVHASSQVAHFSLKAERPGAHFADGLNAILPETIRVREIRRVPDSFSARRSVQKQYSYYFQQGAAPLPHLRKQTFWNRYPLDAAVMNEAVQTLVGEHDFLGFCGAGAQVSSTVRTLHEASVKRIPIPEPGCFAPESFSLVRIRLRGTGFLKQMVRNVAGTLRQIGEGRRPVADMASILASQDRKTAGPTAPPEGLWLDRVWYEESEEIAFLNQA